MKKLYVLISIFPFLGINIGFSQYAILKNFDYKPGTDGRYPYGGLTLSGNVLYGMNSSGALYGFGCIFSIHTDGTNYIVLHNFTDSVKDGAYAVGSLTLSPKGKVLFGMTDSGGANGLGIIFSIDTNGANFIDLHDFSGSTKDGANPYGSLTLSSGVLYGMTQYGGLNNLTGGGIVFSMNTNGAGFTDLHDFGTGPDGYSPTGSLTLESSVLYGLTSYGGVNSQGMLFSINTNGTGYTDLHDFNDPTDAPAGTLTLSASGKVLYGMTSDGGILGYGNVFSINTNGTGFKDLHDFNGTDGLYPYYVQLQLLGKVLYGMTLNGGPFSQGNIFSIDTDGAGVTDICDFNGLTNMGYNPYGSLTLSSGVMYGMALEGGANKYGVVFKFDTTLSTLVTTINTSSWGIKVEPNPNRGVFRIVVSSQLSVVRDARIEIYNVLGQLVYASSLPFSTPNPQGGLEQEGVPSFYKIDLGVEPDGVYFYRVISENEGLVGSGKFVIDK